jgi:hypothetical protein
MKLKLNKNNLRGVAEASTCPTEDTTGKTDKLLLEKDKPSPTADGDVHTEETTQPPRLKALLALSNQKAQEDATEAVLGVVPENGNT